MVSQGAFTWESLLCRVQDLQRWAAGWASVPHTGAYLRAAGELPGGQEARFTPALQRFLLPVQVFFCSAC